MTIDYTKISQQMSSSSSLGAKQAVPLTETAPTKSKPKNKSTTRPMLVFYVLLMLSLAFPLLFVLLFGLIFYRIFLKPAPADSNNKFTHSGNPFLQNAIRNLLTLLPLKNYDEFIKAINSHVTNTKHSNKP